MASMKESIGSISILIVYFLGNVCAQQQFQGPRDVVSTVGVTSVLSCAVDGDVTGNPLSWKEYISNPLGRLIYKSSDGVLGPTDKYRIDTSIEGHYDLHIMNTEVRNGGLYSCGLDDTLEPFRADLIVLDKPTLIKPEIVEDRMVNMRCEGLYGGPGETNIKDSLKAEVNFLLQTTTGWTVLDGIVTEMAGIPKEGDEYMPWSLKMDVNKTFTAAENGLNMSCETSVKEHAYKVEDMHQISVMFAVREITLYPRNLYYYPGEYINCSALGNPLPDYRWEPIMSPGPRPVSVSVLEITSNMIGDNSWKCMARNNADNIEDIEEIINFEVREPEPSDSHSTAITSSVWCIVLSLVTLVSLVAYN